MAEDPDGRLWLGTFGAGLFRYTPAAGSYGHFDLGPSPPRGTDFAFVTILCTTRQDEFWAATRGGLVRFDRRTGGQEVFAARADDPATLGFNRVASILEDSRDDVWIGSDFCLLRWDRRSRTFKRYLHDPNDPGSLSGSHVNPILEDSKGNHLGRHGERAEPVRSQPLTGSPATFSTRPTPARKRRTMS